MDMFIITSLFICSVIRGAEAQALRLKTHKLADLAAYYGGDEAFGCRMDLGGWLLVSSCDSKPGELYL